MTAAPADVARLRVAGRTEYLRIAGDGPGTPVLLVPPLFGEMNRCRRLLVDVMDALAALGRGSAMPDLPGTAESGTPLAAATLADWRAMVAASADLLAQATGRRPVTAAFRGGTVMDDAGQAVARWRMTPVEGATVLRELARAQRMAATAEVTAAGVVFAGTVLHPDLGGPLAAARAVGAARIVRLEDDPKAAELRLPGSPLWRRAEPGRDRALALAIAADIDRTAASCDNF